MHALDTTEMAPRRLPFLPHVEGLRGIAVLAVVIYHLHPALLPGGFTGVDVFFVISGFVVSRSTSTVAVADIRHVLAHFYAHRLVRIVPALAACLVLSMLLLVLFIPEAWLSFADEKSGLAAFYGLSNIVLQRADGDYFAPTAAFNPFTQTWSLGVEEQFYCLFPLLFTPWLAGRKTLSFALFASLGGISLASAALISRWNESAAFFLLLPRFWELALGVGLMMVARRGLLLPGLLSQILLSIGALGLGIAFIATTQKSTPFPGSLLPCAATCLLLVLPGAAPNFFIQRALEMRWLALVGRLSYSLYLWHWPTIVLFRWTVGLDTWPLRLLALAVAFACAAISLTVVERPLRQAFAAGRITQRVALAGGLLVLAVGYGVASGLLHVRPRLSLSTVSRHRTDWYLDLPRPEPDLPDCRIVSNDLPIRSAFSSRRTGCQAPVTFPHNIFVIGDSHAGAYIGMLQEFVRHAGATLFEYTAGGCSVLGINDSEPPACRILLESAYGDVERRVQPGDVVFLPSLRVQRLVEESARADDDSVLAKMNSPQTASLLAAEQKELMPTLQVLAAKSARIVLEAPLPEFRSPPFRCADWFNRVNPICAGGFVMPRDEFDMLRAPVMRMLSGITKEIPGAAIWDPMPVLCAKTTCNAFRDGKPLFFDGDHLSGNGGRVLLASFSYALEHP